MKKNRERIGEGLTHKVRVNWKAMEEGDTAGVIWCELLGDTDSKFSQENSNRERERN